MCSEIYFCFVASGTLIEITRKQLLSIWEIIKILARKIWRVRWQWEPYFCDHLPLPQSFSVGQRHWWQEGAAGEVGMGNGEVDSNPKGLLASEASLLKIAFPILGQTVRHLELLSKYHMWPV